MRTVEKSRQTKETKINLKINLDGKGIYNINTPNHFFNHLLEQLSLHSDIDIDLDAQSLDLDSHHLIEDCAIVLGSAIKEALGDKKGIKRYSNIILPMDDALIMCAVDVAGRNYFELKADIKEEKTEDFETVLFYHFFKSLTDNASFCLHLNVLSGYDPHHIIEASFKAFARCIKDAFLITSDKLPSTKGQL